MKLKIVSNSGSNKNYAVSFFNVVSKFSSYIISIKIIFSNYNSLNFQK